MSGAGMSGRGQPPEATRFRKGRSGNPAGRPKGRGNRPKPETSGSAFEVLLGRTFPVTRDGTECELTVEEALQQRTLQDALAGSRPARRQVLKMIAAREAAREKRRPKPALRVEQKIEPVDPRNADAALLLLGIASRDTGWGDDDKYDRLLLEPWAVQAALSRRRGGARLEDKDIREITRCTRDPDRIRWPRERGDA